jgi:hypothetical protein
VRLAWRIQCAVLVIPFLSSGCSVQIGSSRVDLAKYQSTWEHGWEPVIRAAARWKPTDGTAPPCLAASLSASDCLNIDTVALKSLLALSIILRNAEVPKEYKQAHEEALAAIAQDIHALGQRDRSINTHDAALFNTANNSFKTAVAMFHQSYEHFPASGRPTPVPFGAGGWVG